MASMKDKQLFITILMHQEKAAIAFWYIIGVPA